jgi:hypothetical protein
LTNWQVFSSVNACVVLAFVVLSLLWAASAQAAPNAAARAAVAAQADAQLQKGRSFDAALASVSTKAKRFVADRDGISEAEAARKLAIQAVRPNVEGQLRKTLGAALTSVWFDRDSGDLHVGTSSASDVAAVRDALDRSGLDGHYTVDVLGFGAAELDEGLAEARKALEKELASGVASLGAGAGSIDVTVGKTADAKAIGRRVRDAVAGVKAAIPVRISVSERATLRIDPAVYCAFPWCDTWVGGARFEVGYAGGQSCTGGFKISYPGSAYPYFLTAGHCIYGFAYQTPIFTCNPYTGWCGSNGITGQVYYGGGIPDAGILALSLSWPTYPGYYNWASSGLSTLHTYYTTPAPVGTVVCANGVRTGSSCSTITRTNVTVTYTGGTTLGGMIETHGGCTSAGDSGGPVTLSSYEAAVGLTSGAEDAANVWCGKYAYVTPINDPLSRFGATLDTA